MGYRQEHSEAKGFVADHIGWRAAKSAREQALANVKMFNKREINFEELVKQGLARKIIEQLPCRATRIHYEMINA